MGAVYAYMSRFCRMQLEILAALTIEWQQTASDQRTVEGMGLLMNVASATTRVGCQITLDGFVKGERSAVVVASMF